MNETAYRCRACGAVQRGRDDRGCLAAGSQGFYCGGELEPVTITPVVQDTGKRPTFFRSAAFPILLVIAAAFVGQRLLGG